MRNIILILCMLFLGGCSLYESILRPNYSEESYIQATRKGEILDGLKTVAVIIATHLNTFDAETYDAHSEEAEVFFVDIYISEDNMDIKERGLANKDFSLYLVSSNDEKLSNPELSQVMEETQEEENVRIPPLSVKAVQKEELPLVMQPLVSRWGSYFIVKFPKQSVSQRNHLKLLLVSKTYGIATLAFGIRALQTYGK